MAALSKTYTGSGRARLATLGLGLGIAPKLKEWQKSKLGGLTGGLTTILFLAPQ